MERIRKVRYDGKRVRIEHEVVREGGSGGGDGDDDESRDVYTLSCADTPRPGLRASLEALRPFVCRLLEVKGTWADGLEVVGVSLSWKHGVMGASIVCRKSLSGASSPLLLTTPHRTEDHYASNVGDGQGGGDDAVLMGGDEVRAVRAVVDEARAYVRGEREQLRLGLDEEAA